MISWKNVFEFFVFVFFWFKPDQTPQMVHSTISWPRVFVLFWDFVLILSRLLWECLHILLLVSIGVLIWLQIYMFFEVRGYKFLREPEKNNIFLQRINSRFSKDKILMMALLNYITSWTTVSFLSKHSSGPGWGMHPDGPHNSLGTFLHSVWGVYFFTSFFSLVHLVTGHLEHSWVVEYPEKF